MRFRSHVSQFSDKRALSNSSAGLSGSTIKLNTSAYSSQVEPVSNRVNRNHSSGNDRMERCENHYVFFRAKNRFQNAAHRPAALHAARNLRNHKSRELQIRMVLAVTHQRLRRMFRRADEKVGDVSARLRFRIIEIRGLRAQSPRNCADELIFVVIRPGIQLGDKCVILLRGGLDFKTIIGAIVDEPTSSYQSPFGASPPGASGAKSSKWARRYSSRRNVTSLGSA